MRARLTALLRGTRRAEGAVVVMVALALPVLIGAGGLIIDVGNWYSHKRHLQLQADAGALAGAALYGFGCDDTAIRNEIAKYSSVGVDPGMNPQVGGTPQSRLHSEVNSTTYFNQPSPVDTTVAVGQPCAKAMIDVKLTETGLPWYLKALKVVPHINARARVEFRQKTTATGSLPLGVPDIGPRRAKAIFVNETTGAVVQTADLVRTGTSGTGQALWSNVAAPVAVPINTTDIGVRILLSSSTSTAPVCGGSLVLCYGAGTQTAIVAGTPGLSHIRGYATTAGTAAAPKVRTGELYGLTCGDGYFNAVGTFPCTVNIGAVVDFGGFATNAAIPGTTRVLVRKTGANANTDVALTRPTPATQTGTWTGGALSLATASGATTFTLHYQTGCPANLASNCNTTKTSLGVVQRSFVGEETSTSSGPIQKVVLSENAVQGANSFQSSPPTTHDLVVEIALKPSLQNASSVNDPVVALKVEAANQTQALDCDPAVSNFKSELELGCGPTYQVNTGTPCASPTTPLSCVGNETGNKVGQVGPGLNARILGPGTKPACTSPNNWSQFPNLPAGDKRIVSLFITAFGSFQGTGQALEPVIGFATFYVTGWDNGGCQGFGDDPAGKGEIVGHFIKYIDRLGTSTGTQPCDLTALGACFSLFSR